MRYAILLLLTCLTFNCYSQENTNAGLPHPVADTPRLIENTRIFDKVEVEAEFPGGTPAWGVYLRANLNPDVPVNNKAPKGAYRVIVRFIVKKDGSIQDVMAETRKGYGMEAEVVRIIQAGPKWTPAMQNGRPVNAYRRQPVTFVVE